MSAKRLNCLKSYFFKNQFFIKVLATFCLVLSVFYESVNAQIHIKTEHIGMSQVNDNQGDLLGYGNDIKIVDAAIRFPLRMQKNEQGEVVKATFVSLWGTYASLGSRAVLQENHISSVFNMSLTFGQLLPVTQKWSLLMMIGGGIFTTNFPEFYAKSAFLQGGMMALRKENSKFDWGVGASVNNSYDYAMITPAFLLNWKIDDKHRLKIFYYNYFDFEFSRKISEFLKMSLVAEGEVLLGLHNRKAEEVSFVTQFGHAGVRSDLKIAKSLYMPITVGVSFSRSTYFDEKTFKFYYDVIGDNRLSTYIAAGIRYEG